ncbi:MAG: SH3 domain-containing protein [Spirochaetota bacterium]|nr:SH3 domain-containing protein [Spirochaetota bacterium]
MKRILFIVIAITIGFTSFVSAAKNRKGNKLVVQTAFSLIHNDANNKSNIIGVLAEGESVTIIKHTGEWVKIKSGNSSGYVVAKSLTKKLQKVDKNIYDILTKNKNDKEISSTGKGFSEEEELSAASKGFSEEEELSAASKGFSEEEELSAAAKGFSEEEELSAAAKGFSEEEEISAASKGFSEEEEISAAAKGFKKNKKGFTKNDLKYRKYKDYKNLKEKSMKDNLPFIFSKFYVFDKEQYLKKSKELFSKIR